ncbi:MAG TPA: hypothetical protein VFC42_09725 [Methylomirabilota bacterium]|nr:hypothetical protein [Methylomirabilota bacterium]
MVRGLGLVLALSPLLTVAGLLAIAEWRDRRRATAVARQVRLSDALAAELGAVVAPVVRSRLAGRWRVEILVPVGRPGLVGRIVAITDRALRELGVPQYELVLAPAAVRGGAAPGSVVTRPSRSRRARRGCLPRLRPRPPRLRSRPPQLRLA